MDTATFVPPLFQPSSTFLKFMLDNALAAVAMLAVLALVAAGVWLYEHRSSRSVDSPGPSDDTRDTPSAEVGAPKNSVVH